MSADLPQASRAKIGEPCSKRHAGAARLPGGTEKHPLHFVRQPRPTCRRQVAPSSRTQQTDFIRSPFYMLCSMYSLPDGDWRDSGAAGTASFCSPRQARGHSRQTSPVRLSTCCVHYTTEYHFMSITARRDPGACPKNQRKTDENRFRAARRSDFPRRSAHQEVL